MRGWAMHGAGTSARAPHSQPRAPKRRRWAPVIWTRCRRARSVRSVEPDPRLVELRRKLEHARAQGQEFDTAWEPAVVHAVDGLARWEAAIYRRALTGTRQAWLAAYTGAPTASVERAMTELETYAADGELGSLTPEVAA